MPHRQNYLDLDPTYRNRFGQPLMRMTFDFKDNDLKQNRHAAELCTQIGKAMNPTRMDPTVHSRSWSVVPYQTTHNTGGAMALIGAMLKTGVKKIVLSSTAATYGAPETMPITE